MNSTVLEITVFEHVISVPVRICRCSGPEYNLSLVSKGVFKRGHFGSPKAGLDGSSQMIRIVLADDHRIVRNGLKALLSFESDFEVVGEASNGQEALALVQGAKPDILVLDLMMPVMNGLEVAARLNLGQVKIGIVVLSMHSDQSYILEVLRYGAKGYVLKDNTADELILAIREVFAGRFYLGTSISEEVRQQLKEKADVSPASPLKLLTSREREIFQLAVSGMSNNDIASALGISPRTVETHCVSLNHKLGVSNRSQLVRLAVQRGMVTANDLLREQSTQD